jgi:perosamine synthetase
VQVHYIPVYRHPWYQQNGYADVRCERAEAFYARSISLPIFPKMTDDDVASSIERVRHAVNEVVG